MERDRYHVRHGLDQNLLATRFWSCSARRARRSGCSVLGCITIFAACSNATSPDPDPQVTSVLPGFYVAPGGSAGGDGSIDDPWDLVTALAHPSSVIPGQNTTTLPDGAGGTVDATVIWLRGGAYGSTGDVFTPALTGTGTNPLVLAQFPGEHAVVDGRWELTNSPFLWLSGFESFNSETSQLDDLMGFDMRSEGGRLINLVIHDHLGNGVGTWEQASNAEVYGTIVYNNGRQTAVGGHAHGLYIQNRTGTKRISDTFLFHNLGLDLHGFGSSAASLINVTVERVVLINSSEVNSGNVWRAGTMSNAVFDGLMAYNNAGPVGSFGPNGGDGNDFTFRDAYMHVGGINFSRFSTLTITGNEFIHYIQNALVLPGTSFPSSPVPYDYDRNSYWFVTGSQPRPFRVWKNNVEDPLRNFSEWQAASGYDANSSLTENSTGHPAANKVFVHPNLYEPGRANIVVFNWENLASVSVDVSGILNDGDEYEVRHVFDFYGTPQASGTYGGGTISIPMNAVAPVAPITGWSSRGAPPTPGPEFGAFVLIRVTNAN